MRRLLSVFVLMALHLSIGAQTLYESFTDGDFTFTPVWTGSTATWTIVNNSDVAAGATGSQTLRLNAPATVQTEYLSSSIANWYTAQEWGFWIGRRSQACTNANQSYCWLYANEANLNAPTVDGYRIAIGDDTGPDEIRLQYMVNGAVSSNVIVSSGGLTNGLTDFGILVRVTRTSNGLWTLFTSVLPAANGTGVPATDIPDITNTPVVQGTGTENSLVPASNGFIGVAALHSTSGIAINAAEFDQIYFNQFVPAGIITGAVAAPPFVLPNCTATASGTVNFTTTGLFAGTNDFIAQLSDDAGSFSSPVTIGSISDIGGSDPSGIIPITIPAGTVGGSGYLIRVISNDPAVTGNTSISFTITQNGQGGCGSAATDYYRSIQTGNWSSPGTWESSPDQVNWIPATRVPTFNANTILIQHPHTVYIDATASADQLSILPGAQLNHGNGISFTLNNGSGTDMMVNGSYVLNGSQPAGTGTIEIMAGGVVSVQSNTSPGLADDFAHSNSGVLFRTGSVYEWNTSSFTPEWTGRTYFSAGENVVFRFSASPNFDLGGNSPTVIYGVLEVNAPIELTGTANKVFVNGITGTADLTTDPAFTGLISIGGAATAVLGGSGLINLNPFNASLSLGSGTAVSLLSNKAVNGNLVLLSDTYVELGDFNFTVTGAITGGAANAYIRTNGTGMLTLNAVGAAGKIFPIGNTGYNPLIVTNGNGENFSASVQTGINPAVAFPSYGINRTWQVLASGNTTATLRFQFAAADASAGVILPGDMEILQHSAVAWSVIPGNGIRPSVGSDPYTVSTVNNIPISNAATAYAIGKSGGHLLPLPFFIYAKAASIGLGNRISWEIFNTAPISSFEIQRADNGGAFAMIGYQVPVGNQLNYSMIDSSLQSRLQMYRIKAKLRNGTSQYSNIVIVKNGSQPFIITSLAPNPLYNNATISITAAEPFNAGIAIYNITGQQIMYRTIILKKGANSIPLLFSNLPAGVYYLQLQAENVISSCRFIKQ